MATKKKVAPKEVAKKVVPKVRIRKVETVRDRSKKGQTEKPKRLRKASGSVKRPLKAIISFGRKEFYLPMPNNKFGNFLNKRRSATPRYFIDAWKELRQVTWPDAKETTKLTFAVFIFAIIFVLLISSVDYVLDYIFKKVIL